MGGAKPAKGSDAAAAGEGMMSKSGAPADVGGKSQPPPAIAKPTERAELAMMVKSLKRKMGSSANEPSRKAQKA